MPTRSVPGTGAEPCLEEGRTVWETRVEIRTERTPEEAFAYIAEGFFEHHAIWDPAIEVERTSPGPVGKGSTGVETRRFMGGKQRAGFEITEFERPSRFAFRNTSGPFELDRAYTLEPRGAGAGITFVFRMAPKAFPFTLLFPLIRGTIAKQVRSNIERLGGLLDELPRGSGVS
jgi:hypothetical protein